MYCKACTSVIKLKQREEKNMKMTKKVLSVIFAVLISISMLVPSFAASYGDAEAKPFANSEFFEYNGLNIHYRVFKAAGNEKAKIFMIHGFAMSTCCWEELARRLSAEGYTCVAADLPDFGYSSRENEDSPLYPREDIMHALMTSVDDGKWYVAGHSMGGYIALALAAKYPESVKNLMLFGTACNTGNPQWLNTMMTNKVFVSVTAPLMELAARFDFIVKGILGAALCDAEYLKNYDISKITAPFRIKGSGAGALYSFSVLPKTDLEAVEKMPPVLYMNGDRDMAIKNADRELLRKHLPENSTDITVKGGGHLFIENRADETSAAVLDFIFQNK